jgi:surface protein
MGICEESGKISNSTNENPIKNILDNSIISEIYIKDDEVNKNIRIINSYEEHLRTQKEKEELINEKMNEEEIKKCEITINGESIPFSYFHKFIKKGYYTIKYSFKNYLTKTNYMFYNCSSIENIYPSNFNTENVTDMECMFYGCSLLKILIISNFKTGNVKNMGHMFYGCSSLEELDLSNLDTHNVIRMTCMFEGCKSLRYLNLKNFNTEKVIDMVWMFHDCSSLEFLNIYNFNIQNVIDKSDMFQGCITLKKNDKNLLAKDKKIMIQLLLL